MLYAGIDLGTSSVKLLLADKSGNVLKTVTKEYPLSIPRDGWSEQNPADWYEKTMEGLKELLEGQSKADLGAIGFGAQMHGLVMLDENDNVIRPAILWNDSRSKEECDYLNNRIGTSRLASLTANIAFAGFTAPKILWVQKHEPQNFERCKKIMLPKDYLIYKLCGAFAADPSDASGTLLFDVENKCWSEEMLKICAVSSDMLPQIYPSCAPVGILKEEIAQKIGAGRVIIACGGGDNAAAAVGMGVVGEGKCSISVGTSGTVFITSEHFSPCTNNALHSFAHADGGYHIMGCILSAASCNKWWMEDILKTADFSAEQREIRALGENQVIFLPYLCGERSPHNDPYARGAFVGMGMDTTRADMTQAVMEGVAYALRDCVEIARESGAELAEAKLCGGGAKSRLWQKILADVLRMRLNIPACAEGAAYGGAILAMTAAGEYSSVREASEAVVKTAGHVDFDEAEAKRYDKGYARFKELYATLKNWYRS